MILQFPNLDTLRLALTAGAIPESVGSQAARAGFDDKGQAWVEPAAPISKAAEKELGRLGVQFSDKSALPLDQNVMCWPQLLPLQREVRDRSPGDKTPILFTLTKEEELAELVGEILRLGNDRQGFRWLDRGQAADGATRALLRVVGPPYYSLLRALDHSGRNGAPVAYHEVQPGVWIQIGYRHPLAEQIRPPAGQILLMGPPRQWTFIAEAPFRDIYEVVEFAVPAQTAWQESHLDSRWKVPLRLSHGSAAEPAELWVLKGDAVAQVDELVQNADDHLLARLAFAVGDKNGERVIVLRVRPSKQAPPVLVLSGVGFRPYLRLPNLYLPCGARLHPPLRRDVVAKLLAGDPKQINWLYPESSPHAPRADDGTRNVPATFTPESLPDTAFRPLHDWIDYVLDQEHVPLTAWVQAARFDFEPFVCKDDQPAKKPEPREPKAKRPKDKRDEGEAPSEPALDDVKKGKRKKQEDYAAEEAVAARPNEAEQSLRALEKEFLEIAGSLDAPARQALWPRMARLNGVLGQTDSAAICWGHALWETAAPPAAWLNAWFQAERPSAAHPSAADLDRVAAQESPTLTDIRAMVAALVWAGHEATPPPEFKRVLGKIPQLLEKHEPLLGVRTLWLAWTALHRLTHGDVLALARARDRILERLYVNGLSADLDLPSFLRFTGARSSERFRLVRDQIMRLVPIVEKWTLRGNLPVPGTLVYTDLMFAYALARLGEATEARKLLRRGPERLTAHDQVHEWLIAAFEFRIQQAFEGTISTGRLPSELLERLEGMERLARYKIDRQREHSRILEPHEKIDPYRRWHGRFADDLSRELAGLFDVDDRAELLNRLNRLLAGQGKWARGKEAAPRILATAVELAPRLGENFAEVVLERAETVLDKLPDPLERALLLEKSLYLAGHYDRSIAVQSLMAQFHRLLQDGTSTLPLQNLESLLGHSFRSLRKLGLRDEIGRLLQRLAELIQAHPAFRAAKTGPKTAGEGERQRLLLQVASGWFYFGQDDRARPLLDQARSVLFSGNLVLVEQTALAAAYAATLGQAPIDLALARIMELFRKVEGVYDTYTTHTHFSLSRLDVVEATLLALVSDDFTIAPEARRLLDDDEYLVRRRIHRDVRQAMDRSGL